MILNAVIPAKAGIQAGRVSPAESSFQRKLEPTLIFNVAPNLARSKMGSSFRWNDGDVVHRRESAHTLRAWIPAFAGMTG